MAKPLERLQIMLTEDELVVLDDFRYKQRMPSRASAIRELLKRGLAAEGFPAAAFGAKSEELGFIRNSLGDFPLVGFFANGEISHNRLYGYTGVLTLFV
jgi:small ligand-binding sensory domain FIST